MEPIYHTNLEIPILSLLFGVVLILGLYKFGQIIIQKIALNNIINRYSENNYQNILVSTSLTLFIFYPLILFFNSGIIFLKIYTYIIFILGIFCLLDFSKNYFKVIINNLPIQKKPILSFNNLEILLIFLLISGFFLLSFAPVTNADSVDYHLYAAKYILEYGQYPNFLTNFHSTRLSGAGELMIVMGLLVGSEQFSSILQATGLITLFGVLKKNHANSFFWLILLSSPVLIFFISSIKPQLFNICASSFVFTIIIKEIFTKTKISNERFFQVFIFCIFILFINTQVKFSFFLSSFILTSLLIYVSIKKKIYFKIFITLVTLYVLIILPPTIWKYIQFESNFFELFISPALTDTYGLKSFYTYLTNLNQGNFLLWMIVPQDIKLISQSLGLGTLLFLFLFSKFKKENIFMISIIVLFMIFVHYFGQYTARFFLEIYFWLSLFFIVLVKQFRAPFFYKLMIYAQSSLVILILFFGVITLTKGVISANLRDHVLSNHANGYLFFKWTNHQLKGLKYDGPIISSKRSIGFLNNISIPPEHLYFVDYTKKESLPYVEEIKKIDPKYLIVSKETNLFDGYNNCIIKEVTIGKKIDKLAVRNPFLESSVYSDVYIYELNLDIYPACLDKNFKSVYKK